MKIYDTLYICVCMWIYVCVCLCGQRNIFDTFCNWWQYITIHPLLDKHDNSKFTLMRKPRTQRADKDKMRMAVKTYKTSRQLKVFHHNWEHSETIRLINGSKWSVQKVYQNYSTKWVE